MVKDGFGCFSYFGCSAYFGCFGDRGGSNVVKDTKIVTDDIKLENLFQCSVSDVMKIHPEDSDIKSYGIVRRKNSRFNF